MMRASRVCRPSMNAKLATARGCCPRCGHDVALLHSFNGARLTESYGCYRCGPTRYVLKAIG